MGIYLSWGVVFPEFCFVFLSVTLLNGKVRERERHLAMNAFD